MIDQTARTRACLADLAAIITEIETKEVPPPQVVRKRTPALKPLWEE